MREMTGTVPTADPPYGRTIALSPLIRRVLAPNSGPFTYTGTGTYIVGHGTVAMIDPGPDDPGHVAALLAATCGETISDIVVTHTHRDHSPAAVAIKAASGARVVGCAPLVLNDQGPRADAGFDSTYAPDLVLADGETIAGPEWTLHAVSTPGHTSNHLCFALTEERALFSGDHVMGWSTTVVAPPDGDMAAYLASLARLLERDDRIYYPTHGEPVTRPKPLVRGLIAHRRTREAQILQALSEAPKTIEQMVATMYAAVDPKLHPAAGRSVLAHLIELCSNRRVVADGDVWRLAA